jgi:hypothetical protein
MRGWPQRRLRTRASKPTNGGAHIPAAFDDGECQGHKRPGPWFRNSEHGGVTRRCWSGAAHARSQYLARGVRASCPARRSAPGANGSLSSTRRRRPSTTPSKHRHRACEVLEVAARPCRMYSVIDRADGASDDVIAVEFLGAFLQLSVREMTSSWTSPRGPRTSRFLRPRRGRRTTCNIVAVISLSAI